LATHRPEGSLSRLAVPRYDHRLHEVAPFPALDPLMLPEVVIDDYPSSAELQRSIRPVLDAVWNAAGFARSDFYDANGDWNPPRS